MAPQEPIIHDPPFPGSIHPQYAYQMLSPISYLNQALIILYYHHERWDGSGCPHGSKTHAAQGSHRIP